MKKGLILLFFAITLSISGATYYVSPTGNDGAAGTQSAPWLSWNYAFNRLVAGDILYVRGGTYTKVLGGAAGAYFGVRVANRNGTASNPIKVMASPGEVPVLDCSGLTPYAGAHYGMILDNCDYWYIKGLTVKSVREYSSGGTFPYTGSGWELTASTYITLEQCSVTDCMNGFSLNSFVNYIYYINCDSYKNYDYYDNGGLCNGFNGNVNAGSQVFYTGCRAYSNSDDGFDNMAGGGYMTYTNCWAWRNGYDIPISGDGDGFKLGFTTKGDEAGVQRTLYNCIAANNKLMGFDESMDATTSMDMALYNCIAYSNSNDFGFRFSHSSGTGITTLKNNVSYLSRSGANYEGRSRNISNRNSWDAGAPTVSDADFVNVDWTELARARKADGSLPDVNFLHLATGSDLIDAGVDVGIAFSGKAPDLGAFETQTGSTPTPLYVSSAIGNSTPSLLEMTYDMTLASIVPAASSFSILVNSTSRSVSSVAVSGTKVQLTLASPVVYGDNVTVSYTKPSSNPLQTVSGAQAATISSQSVTNKVNSISPVYVSSAVENTTPSLLEMTYNMNLTNVVSAASAFSVRVNSTARAVSAVAVSGTKVLLTLASPIVYGNVVTVSYTKPSANPLQTASGAQAATISAQPVTNKVNPVIPVYVSSVVENATPALLEMTYNMNLANKVPSASAFKVLVNSSSRSVSSVAVSGAKVLLTLSSAVVNGNVVTVAYNIPSTNPLQTSAGAQAASIGTQNVTNNVNAPAPVYVSSLIADATPSVLEMTYNMNLANIVPAASAFSVLVNSAARTVSSVAVSGTKILLTLSSPIVYGNVVTVSYTKPSRNPLQTTSGGQAASISTQTVTNKVNSVNLVYVSSVVENATPSVLEMTYNLTLANIVPDASAFSVRVNSAARTVSSVAVSGTKVLLTLSSPIVYGNVVTVSYTKPSRNPLQTTSGGQAATISSQTVKNNAINAAPTAAITSPANNAVFTALSNITIAANASDPDGSVTLVEFFNGSTKLGSTSAAPYTFTLDSAASGTYLLTVVATDNLNAKTKSSEISISVNEGTPSANQPPVVAISNPVKGNNYESPAAIDIDVVASDPDGTIRKVELYVGSDKLVELTSAPYSYAWKDVKPGAYVMKAIATDNLNATTTSSSLEFSVGNISRYDADSEILNLYPNPSDGHFSIELVNPLQSEKCEILITDLSGKQVYHGSLLQEEILKHFDLSGVKSGIYIMMIIDNVILVTKKIIKY